MRRGRLSFPFSFWQAENVLGVVMLVTIRDGGARDVIPWINRSDKVVCELEK